MVLSLSTFPLPFTHDYNVFVIFSFSFVFKMKVVLFHTKGKNFHEIVKIFHIMFRCSPHESTSLTYAFRHFNTYIILSCW